MDRRNDVGTPSQTLLPAGSAIRPSIRVRDGVAFSVVTESEPLDPISRTLARGIFPPLCRPLIDLVEAMVPPGGRVLDLGSHVGTFALAAAASGRQVVALEASPRNAALLAASIEANQFGNLRLIHAAVGDGPGTLQFFSNGPFGHVDPSGGGGVGSVPVPAMAGDDILESVGWDRVDFIKMDIEGSELAGLLGLSRLLSRPDAPPLFVESNGHTLHLFGESPRSLKAALTAYGYELFQVEERRLIPVGLAEFQGTTVVDYLAVKSSPKGTRGWRVDRPMPPREQIRRARASCLSSLEAERLYAARTIGHAPEIVRSDRRVVRAFERLKADPVSTIRSEAEDWSLSARPEPWYAFWRR